MGDGGGQDGSFKFIKGEVQGCIRSWYEPMRSLIQREIYSRCLYSIPQDVQSLTAIIRLAKLPFGPQIAHTDCHYASESSQLKQATYMYLVLNKKFNTLFIYIPFVFMVKKSNLLT